uniref:Uncharacterized protein n=1 Tax=Chenopodium quinoa TaxID=63459 RepID=A0A803LPB7_CHEQI
MAQDKCEGDPLFWPKLLGKSGEEGKNAWPELLGKNAQVAKRIIETQNPFVRAIIKKQTAIVTHDYVCSRVWIWTDNAGNVVVIPHVG